MKKSCLFFILSCLFLSIPLSACEEEPCAHKQTRWEINETEHSLYCEDCETLLSQDEHDTSLWETNDTHHWKICSICNAKTNNAAHIRSENELVCDVCEHEEKFFTNENSILVIEREEGESESLVALLESEEWLYDVEVTLSADLPSSVYELRPYNEIILNNIANADLPQDFDAILTEYVSTYGGGLLTVGGDKAYDKSDMFGSLYQELLPVQATNYTPPVAVMIIIDRSASMLKENNYGITNFETAKDYALAVLDSLTSQDYVGIITMRTQSETILNLTPRTQENVIREAILSLEEPEGSTLWTGAIERAGTELRALNSVAKRHIIAITDGFLSESREIYESLIQGFNQADGTVFSVIGVDIYQGGTDFEELQYATEIGKGRLYCCPPIPQLVQSLHEDIILADLEEYINQPFSPQVHNPTSKLIEGITIQGGKLQTTLYGYNGVNLREGAETILEANYGAPLYAQWTVWKGKVGSFTCDLQASKWSSEFMESEGGQRFIFNVIDYLMAK